MLRIDRTDILRSRSAALVSLLLLAVGLKAQRSFEVEGNVFYVGVDKAQVNLGSGFNPLITADGRVALIGGHRFGYGEPFDCGHRETKNWIVLYDPVNKHGETIFDRELPFDGKLGFCVFEQMQLSHDGSTLYLVSPVSATSGSLAVIDLKRGSVAYLHGVMLVYVIETGSHRDELIYQRRIWHRSAEDGLEYPGYPLVHAHGDGRPITEISNESFTMGGNDELPLLRAYLRRIGATITVDGRKLP